jgi:hypothetical protein
VARIVVARIVDVSSAAIDEARIGLMARKYALTCAQEKNAPC